MGTVSTFSRNKCLAASNLGVYIDFFKPIKRIEQNVVVMAACVPPIRPMLSRAIKRIGNTANSGPGRTPSAITLSRLSRKKTPASVDLEETVLAPAAEAHLWAEDRSKYGFEAGAWSGPNDGTHRKANKTLKSADLDGFLELHSDDGSRMVCEN